MAWLCYAGDVRRVAVKLSTWKGSGAHPKHARAEIRTKGAAVKRVDGHSSHGDAGFIDGGVPVAVVDKRLNQQGTKHHGNMAK